MATVSPAAADKGVAEARPRRVSGSGRAAAAVALIAALLVCIHLLVRAEGPRWASPLLVGEWLFTVCLALAILTVALAVGRTLARPLRGQDDALSDQLAALGIGVGALSLGMLSLGVLHLYYAPVILAALLALALALRGEIAVLWREGGRLASSRFLAGTTPALTPGQRVLLVLLAGTLCFVCFRNTIPVIGDVPDLDGVTYHLSGPKLYLAAHQILPLPDIPLANAPEGIEMLSVAGMAAGTDTLMKVLNLLFGLGLGLATYSFGRRHLEPDAALYGVFALFAPAWVIELMTGTVPDFATALFLVLGVSDGLAWLSRVEREGAGKRRLLLGLESEDRLLIRSGLLLGISISCKLTSGPVLPALALTLGLGCLGLRGLAPAARLVAAVRGGAILCLAGIVPLAPWLLKSAILFHNPLYPAAGVVNGANCSDNNGCTAYVTHIASTGLHARLDQLWAMVTTTADLCWHYGGPPTVALLLAPLLLRRSSARQTLLFLLIGAVLWLKLVPLFVPPRYWLGLIAIAEAVAAATLWNLVRRLPLRPARADWPLLLYLVPASLWTLTISLGLAQRSGAFDLIGGSISRHDYLAERVRPYEAFDWVNAHTPRGAVVVTINTSLGYYLDRSYLNDWYGTRYNRLLGGDAARADEIARWCRAGVQFAVFNRGQKEYNIDNLAGIRPLGAYIWTSTPGLGTQVRFSSRGVDVLALHPCSVGSAGISS